MLVYNTQPTLQRVVGNFIQLSLVFRQTPGARFPAQNHCIIFAVLKNF